MRCIRHYHIADYSFFSTILNHSSFRKVWIMKPPGGCVGPAQDVINKLQTFYNASILPSYPGNETTVLIYEFNSLRSGNIFSCVYICISSLTLSIILYMYYFINCILQLIG